MAAPLVGGAAVGAVFGELLKAVLEMKDKALMFKPTLEYLTTTLDLTTHVIKEIEQHNNELGRPKEELEYLIRKMEEGTKLVYKCSKISKLNFPARIRHQEQLAELVESLVRFFIVNMQAQISRDVKETLLKVRRIHSAVNKRSRSFVRTAGSYSDSASEEVDLNQKEMHDSSATQPADENAMETNSTEEAIDHPERLSLGADADQDRVNELEALESKSTQPDTEEAGTSSLQQVMEGVTSLSQKIEANAENSQTIECSMSEEFYDRLNTNEKRLLDNSLPKNEPPVLQHKIGGFKGQVIRKDPFEPRKIIAFEGCPSNFDLEDLLTASAEVIGETVYGTSYKTILKDKTTTLVMKRVKDVVLEKTEFDKHMKIVQRLSQHPNIVPLLACYYSKHEKLLIYDYIPGDSFSRLLHGTMETGQTFLDWDSRMKISLGVAKGIAHIHSANEGEFVHGNISSSNVLVKADHQGYISYFGLNSLINDSFNQFGNMEIEGYQAPEVFQSKELTHKSDVYSFGVLLFEMLTTESPLQCNKFLSWVAIHGKKRFSLLAFDHAIHLTGIYGTWRRMMELATACVARKPKWRPSMSEVVSELEEISKSN